jgi:hypothetical protein
MDTDAALAEHPLLAHDPPARDTRGEPRGSGTACAATVAGRNALQVYDEVVQNASGNNLKVLGLISNESWIGGQDLWTQNNAEHNPGKTGDNPYAAAFAQNAAGKLASYLCSTYKMGISKAGWTAGAYPFNAIAQHLYIDQGALTTSSKLTQYMQDLRNAYVAYEGTGTTKQLHITEVGWTTASVSPQTQAANVQTAYTTFKSTGYVGRAYWFAAQDVPESGLYYGLVDSDGLSKPALSAYQTYAT